MPNSIVLGGDDIRIIGHAINWCLNVPFEATDPIELSDEESQVLRILLNELQAQQRVIEFGSSTINLEIGPKYFCVDGQMCLPIAYFRQLTDTVASFVAELHHSPSEVEAVTGLPVSMSSALLLRLQAI